MSGPTIQSVPLFIDSEVWDRAGLNFNSPEIRVLVELVTQGRFRLLSTSITQREVTEHVKLAGSDVKQKLEHLRKALRPFQSADTPLCGVVDNAISQDWSQLLVDQFSGRMDDLGVEIIDCSDVSIDVILNRYFDKEPPFGLGKKKDEFPDAIASEALEQWATSENCEVCVVTADEDWRKRCEASTRLRHFDSLKVAFDHFTDEKLSEAISKGLKENVDKIKAEVARKLQDRGTTLVDLNGDVEDLKLASLNLVEVHLSLIDGHRFVALVDCDIEAQAHASYDDPGSFFWDSEDRRAYHGQKTGHATAAFSDTIEIEGSFELSNPASISIDSVWVSQRDIEFSVANP